MHRHLKLVKYLSQELYHKKSNKIKDLYSKMRYNILGVKVYIRFHIWFNIRNRILTFSPNLVIWKSTVSKIVFGIKRFRILYEIGFAQYQRLWYTVANFYVNLTLLIICLNDSHNTFVFLYIFFSLYVLVFQ